MFNANNYGFNPYMRYGPQQPLQSQPMDLNNMSNRPILNGKQVDSLDAVRAADVPFDGSISYFPLTDGTAIITKQLQTDGTSKIVTYKPIEDKKQEIEYVTKSDLKEFSLEEMEQIKEELKDIKKEIEILKKEN